MSDIPQMGPGWPFGAGGPDLSQIMRMLQSEGPVNWEVAGQVAAWVATVDPETGRGDGEPAADPATVTRLEELVRAAQTAVAAEAGLTEAYGVPVRACDRRSWAAETMEGLKPVLEALARTFEAPLGSAGAQGGAEDAADPFAGLMVAIAPILLGVQAGSMIGFLAQHALGQYDLPLPLSGEPRLAFVTANVERFAADWSIPFDDVCYALALREVVHAAQRTLPWVRDRLVRLSTDYVSAYELDTEALEARLSGLDLTDPASLQEIGLDPDELLAAMRSERQQPLLEDLQRFVAVLEGYTDTVVERLGSRMVNEFARIDEALRRHRVERGQAAGYVDALLGLALDREHYDLGHRFCAGVVERAGPAGLDRLWSGEAMLPTANELSAPGLWLARIDLDHA